MNTLAEGQVMEINWRATRIRTTSNDIIVMPNSVIAKAVVTNHRRVNDPLWRTVGLSVDHGVAPSRVIEILEAAVRDTPGLAAGKSPIAYARGIADSVVQYDVSVAIDNFADALIIESEIVKRVVDAFIRRGIPIGSAPTDVRIIPLDGKSPSNPPTLASIGG